MLVVTLTYLTDRARVDEPCPTIWPGSTASARTASSSPPVVAVPRTGGVILAGWVDRAELDRRLATDPFAERGVAGYEVTGFVAAGSPTAWTGCGRADRPGHLPPGRGRGAAPGHRAVVDGGRSVEATADDRPSVVAARRGVPGA